MPSGLGRATKRAVVARNVAMTPRPEYTTERAFQRVVEQLLTLHGWRYYHTHDSRRSIPGFPDIVALRGHRLLALELKTRRGRATADQLAWLVAFAEIPFAWSGIVRTSDDISELEALVL